MENSNSAQWFLEKIQKGNSEVIQYESFSTRNRTETPTPVKNPAIEINEDYYSDTKNDVPVKTDTKEQLAQICKIHKNLISNFKPPFTEESLVQLTEQYRLQIMPLMDRYKISRLPLHLADEM